MIKKVLAKLFNSADSSFNSKILSVVVGLFLLTATTFLILFGVPPEGAIGTTDLIWGLIVLITGSSGAEIAGQIFNKKQG